MKITHLVKFNGKLLPIWNDGNQELFSANDLAAYFGLTVQTIHKRIVRKKLNVLRVRGATFIAKRDMYNTFWCSWDKELSLLADECANDTLQPEIQQQQLSDSDLKRALINFLEQKL